MLIHKQELYGMVFKTDWFAEYDITHTPMKGWQMKMLSRLHQRSKLKCEAK